MKIAPLCGKTYYTGKKCKIINIWKEAGGIGSTENVFAEERKNLIVDYVKLKSKATVGELCEKFSVSPATIRNDLRELADYGLLERTHGGAMIKSSVNFELSNVEKEIVGVEQKKAIAKKALHFVKDGISIALDAGTTCLELAKLLGHFRDLTVVTNDLNIAAYLDGNTNVNVILAGGQLRKGFHYTVGDMAVATLENLNVDVAFIAANGVDCEKGLSTPKFETGMIKKKMIDHSKEVVVLADSKKINFVSFVKFGKIEDADILITDEGADEEFAEAVRAKGVRVELAPVAR